jgi:molecular chaperone GrpE
MTSDKKERKWGRIPIRFSDASDDASADESASEEVESREDESEGQPDDFVLPRIPELATEPRDQVRGSGPLVEGPGGRDNRAESEASGPIFAELIATRAELKRLEAEVSDFRDKFARRQADFENFRKRVERERSETYNRAVADLVTKLLPVVDNLGRALDTEASVEASESDEFRHFLSGVDLIYKQLEGVLEALGVKPVTAVGEPFDPHVHEAVVTEETDHYEPDTVTQEIVRGYRLGDKLLRPALVKVAVKK